MSAALTAGRLGAILDAVPDELLGDPLARGDFRTAGELRARYLRYLTERIAAPRAFEGAPRQRSVLRPLGAIPMAASCPGCACM